MDMTKSTVALLPLKAHSARVPKKNFRLFCGKPLVRWILDTLLSIDAVECIVINTDARGELRDIGIFDDQRVAIRDRRSDLCGDDISMNKVLADDIDAVDARVYLMTHATNPLLSSTTICAALNAFALGVEQDTVDSLFTVNRFQSRFYRADARPVNHDPANLVPTQDLEPWFEENSNLYIFSRESFAATGARIGPRPMMFETPKLESFDIDTLEDWNLAERVAGSIIRARGAV